MNIGVLKVKFNKINEDHKDKKIIEFIVNDDTDNVKSIINNISMKNNLEILLRTIEYKRTIPQNAYVYYLIDQLAEAVGTSKMEMKKEMLKEYGKDRFERIRPAEINNFAYKKHIYNTEILKEIKIKTGKYLYIKYNNGISLSTASELDRLITGMMFECKELNINTDLRMVET